MIRPPRAHRHEDAKDESEDRVCEPPGLDDIEQAARMLRQRPTGAGEHSRLLDRKDRQGERRQQAGQDCDPRPFPLREKNDPEHFAASYWGPTRNVRSSSTKPSSRSRSTTSRTEAPTPSKYCAIGACHPRTTQ